MKQKLPTPPPLQSTPEKKNTKIKLEEKTGNNSDDYDYDYQSLNDDDLNLTAAEKEETTAILELQDWCKLLNISPKKFDVSPFGLRWNKSERKWKIGKSVILVLPDSGEICIGSNVHTLTPNLKQLLFVKNLIRTTNRIYQHIKYCKEN